MHLVRYLSTSGFSTKIRLSDSDICIFTGVYVYVSTFVDTFVINVTLTVAIALTIVPSVMLCSLYSKIVVNYTFLVPGVPLLALYILHLGKRSFVLLFYYCATKLTT
jgi:hypothetical protein